MKPQDPVLSLADGPTESASLSTRLSLTTRLSLATVALYHKTVARCQDCHSLPQDCRSLPNKTVAHYQTRLSLTTKQDCRSLPRQDCHCRSLLPRQDSRSRCRSLPSKVAHYQTRLSLPNKTVATKQDCRYQTRHSLCRSLPNKTRLSLSLTTKQDTLSVALYQTRHSLCRSLPNKTLSVTIYQTRHYLSLCTTKTNQQAMHQVHVTTVLGQARNPGCMASLPHTTNYKSTSQSNTQVITGCTSPQFWVKLETLGA